MRALPSAAAATTALGAGLVLSQVFRATPWQAGIALGVLIAGAGLAQLVDERRRRVLQIRRRARARRGYLGGSR
jgi:hypothetical protein